MLARCTPPLALVLRVRSKRDAPRHGRRRCDHCNTKWNFPPIAPFCGARDVAMGVFQGHAQDQNKNTKLDHDVRACMSTWPKWPTEALTQRSRCSVRARLFCRLVRTQRVRCSELIEAQASRDTMACFSAKVQDRRVIAEAHTICTAMGIVATKNTTQIPRPAGKTSCTCTRLLSSVTSAIWYPPASTFQFGCDAHTLQGCRSQRRRIQVRAGLATGSDCLNVD